MEARSERSSSIGLVLILMPLVIGISYFQGLKAYLSWLYKLIWDLGEWGAPGGSPLMLLTVLAFASPLIAVVIGRRVSTTRVLSVLLLFISVFTVIIGFNLPAWAEMLTSSLIVGLFGILLPYTAEFFSGVRNGARILAMGFLLAVSYELSIHVLGVTYGPTLNPRLLPVQVVISTVAAYLSFRIRRFPYNAGDIPAVKVSSLRYVLTFSGLWIILFLQFTIFGSPSFLLRLSHVSPGYLGIPLLSFLLVAAVSMSVMFPVIENRPLVTVGCLIIVVAILSIFYVHGVCSLAPFIIGQFFIALNMYMLVWYAVTHKPSGGKRRAVSAACILGNMLLFLWTVMYTFTFVYAFLPAASPFRGKLLIVMVPASIIASIPVLAVSKGRQASVKLGIGNRVLLVLAIPLLVLGISAPMYRVSPVPSGGEGIRVMTYNIHEGFNVDGRLCMEAIAETIMEFNPDILVLQEVDQGCAMTAYLDEAVWLGKRLNMFLVYVPALEGVWQGDIILSKYPVSEFNYTLLESPAETDVLLWATLDVDGRSLTVFAVHFTAVDAENRRVQVEKAVKMVEAASTPLVWAGDFNIDAYTENPIDRENLARILSVVQDTFSLCPPDRRHGDYTSSSWNPHERIDYIFVSEGFKVLSHGTIYSLASDHLPVYAEIVAP